MSDAKPETTEPETELDMDNGHDRAMARRAARGRWPVSEALKAKLMNKLESVIDNGDPRDITSAGRLIVAAEQQNQADDHLDRKEQRADEGKPSDVIVYEVNMPSPNRISGE